MCGIFGWAGKSVNKFNVDKFNILGLYNIERGKDSCGVAIDGEAYYGLEKESSYKSFIEKYNHKKPEIFPTVLGHTRSASVGNAKIKENAHPFNFGSIYIGNEDKIENHDINLYKWEFQGVHNGTLLNEDELCALYKINKTVWHGKKSRQKIDSEILLETLYKNPNDYSVLSSYNGAAALAWVNNEEPNTLYLFRGESGIYKNNTKLHEERPLYVYIESKNSMYFSSLEESLNAISTVKDSVFEILPNTVYKIKNGDYIMAETFIINRDENYQKENIIYVNNYNNYNNYNKEIYNRNYSSGYNKFISSNNNINKITNQDTTIINNTNRFVVCTYSQITGLYETSNKDKLTGIYTFNFNNKYGLIFLTLNPRQLQNKFNKYRLRNLKKFNIPSFDEDIILYFYEGILLNDKNAYKDFYDKKITIYNIPCIKLSTYSRYPVISNNNSYDYYYNGKLASNIEILPLFSENIIKFSETGCRCNFSDKKAENEIYNTIYRCSKDIIFMEKVGLYNKVDFQLIN